MNELFAIDPDAVENIKELKITLEKFGFENGRFIADFPNEWFTFVFLRMKHLEGTRRSQLEILLRNHKDALLDIGCKFSKSHTWEENIEIKRLQLRRIYKFLGKEPNDTGIDSLSNFLWDYDLGNDSIEDYIPMNIPSYLNAITPIFQHHTEIHFYDRFFKLREDKSPYRQIDRQRHEVLTSILREASKYERPDKFIIHFEDESSFSNYINEIRYDLRIIKSNLKNPALSIGFVMHKKMDHPRYIFGIKGGLKFDEGFRVYSDRSRKNLVTWMSKKALKNIVSSYIDASSPEVIT